MTDQALIAAFWGFLGAFVYAGPKFSACLYTANESGGRWGWCALEGVIALATGTIAAAALTPWAQHLTRLVEPRDLPAVAGMIGLLANPLAPGLIDAVSGRILRRIREGMPRQ